MGGSEPKRVGSDLYRYFDKKNFFCVWGGGGEIAEKGAKVSKGFQSMVRIFIA